MHSRKDANSITRGLTPSKKESEWSGSFGNPFQLLLHSKTAWFEADGHRKPRTITDIKILPLYIPYDGRILRTVPFVTSPYVMNRALAV
jgi:hypothetical protein